MGGSICFPTYIDLEIPEPMATRIRRYRKLFDKARAQVPPEITVAGSCGVGPIACGQDMDDVFAVVDSVAKSVDPFDAAFDKVERFSSSDTYYLTFRNPEPFKRLHKAFAESGILFEPSPYPFTPHCTLKLRKRPFGEEFFKLFFLKPPKGYFTLDSVSVYSLQSPVESLLLHKAKLGSA